MTVSNRSTMDCRLSRGLPVSFTRVHCTATGRPPRLWTLCEVLMDERDRRRSFAHRGCHTFHRPMADVTCGKDAGHARFQQVRLPLQRPCCRQVSCAATVETEIPAGSDVPSIVALDSGGQT